MITAVSSSPLKRCSNVPASSSIANTTLASGVLNAVAMPAAPPARMKREAAWIGKAEPPAEPMEKARADMHRRAFTADGGPDRERDQCQQHLARGNRQCKHAAANSSSSIRRLAIT